MAGMTRVQMRNRIAKAIWDYHECPWSFDDPPDDMAILQKNMAVDCAEKIIRSFGLGWQMRPSWYGPLCFFIGGMTSLVFLTVLEWVFG